MRRLLLLRHAKAAPSAGRDDHGRALTASGRQDAAGVGDRIAAWGPLPEIVIYSSAARTRETAEIVASRWRRKVKFVAEPSLYDATRAMMLIAARGIPDEAGIALMVGHNPGIGDLANFLAEPSPEDDRLRLAMQFPTAGLAILEFAVARWEEIAPKSGRLAVYAAPAEIGVVRE